MSIRPNLVRELINAAEKAANIARICRSNEQLLSLLVQEKTGAEANARFEHDFKTLADVLIQETIKHDIAKVFPEMQNAIKGEESPNFTNRLGETVAIRVGGTPTDTEQCLMHVLDMEYKDAIQALVTEVHRNVEFVDDQLGDVPELPSDLDYSRLGIWIDPIDATAEYISGDTIFTDFPGITSTGLDCVTVLIGVYDRTTGTPVMGIVSQPFHNKISENVYSSLLFWGVALPSLRAHSKALATTPERNTRLGIFSSSERAEILQQLLDLGYQLTFSAGAGHKALKVITGEVDIYVLSKGSTFKWDTCAPQAILRSLGGDMYEFDKSIEQCQPLTLKYFDGSEGTEGTEGTDATWKCNKGGIVAVRDVSLLQPLLQKLIMSKSKKPLI